MVSQGFGLWLLVEATFRAVRKHEWGLTDNTVLDCPNVLEYS